MPSVIKPKLYLETTIPSYLTARPSANLLVAARQRITHDWWRLCRGDYEVYASQEVLKEAARGDIIHAGKRMELLEGIPLLDVTENVLVLLEALLDSKIIPEKAASDAAHIAFSAAHGIDFLVTWNCAHIANANLYRRIEEKCRQFKLRCPLICTPQQLLGDYNHELEDEGNGY